MKEWSGTEISLVIADRRRRKVEEGKHSGWGGETVTTRETDTQIETVRESCLPG